MASISLLCTMWIMAPAQRKSKPLNIACVNKWNIDAI